MNINWFYHTIHSVIRIRISCRQTTNKLSINEEHLWTHEHFLSDSDGDSYELCTETHHLNDDIYDEDDDDDPASVIYIN